MKSLYVMQVGPGLSRFRATLAGRPLVAQLRIVRGAITGTNEYGRTLTRYWNFLDESLIRAHATCVKSTSDKIRGRYGTGLVQRPNPVPARDESGAAGRGNRTQAGLRMARRARRSCAASVDHGLHATCHLDGVEIQALRRTDERLDPGGGSGADEGRGQVRSGSRCAVFDLCGLVDQGVDPGLRDAQLVDRADRVHVVAEVAVLQHAPRSGPA